MEKTQLCETTKVRFTVEKMHFSEIAHKTLTINIMYLRHWANSKYDDNYQLNNDHYEVVTKNNKPELEVHLVNSLTQIN